MLEHTIDLRTLYQQLVEQCHGVWVDLGFFIGGGALGCFYFFAEHQSSRGGGGVHSPYTLALDLPLGVVEVVGWN